MAQPVPAGTDNGRAAGALLATPAARSTALAEGSGWDSEYPRDTWRLRNLGISPARQRRHATSAGSASRG